MTIANSILSDRGDALLAAIVDGYSDNSLTPPDYRVVTFGEVPWDCESLIVEIRGVVASLPTESGPLQPIRCYTVRSVEMVVHLIRCWPTMDDEGHAPTASAINEAADRIMKEAWVMGNAVLAHYKSKELYPDMEVVLGELRPADNTPSGGYTSWVQTVRVEIT